MKKIDLAYTAGIMDGEGSIGIAKHKSRSCRIGYTFELYVQVTSSDEWLCQWLRFGYGGSLSHSTNNAGNPMWHWIIASRKAGEYLKLICPFLKLKKPQAELAIQFQDAKKHSGHKTDKQWAVEEAQRILLQNMHRRPNGSHKGLRQEMPDAL